MTVTPGKQFAADEKITLTKLNQLGAPTVELDDEDIDEVVEEVKLVMPYVNRNLLINGNFDIWQRWAAALNPPFGEGSGIAYAADRWGLGTPSGANKRSITAGFFTLGQSVVPHEPAFYLHWDQTATQTGDYHPTLSQPIEDVRTLAGKNAVVSWWMRSDTTLTVTCQLEQFFGDNGGAPGSGTTVVVAATSGGTASLTAGAAFVQFTAKFEVPSLNGQTTGGSNNFLRLAFIMPQGSTYEVDFAQVQLEEGTVATSYEVISYLETHLRCQRYYEYHGGLAMDDIAHGGPCYYFATRKYRAPTLTLVAGYAGTMTAANFSTILDTGYYQDTANSVVSLFFMACEAEIEMP